MRWEPKRREGSERGECPRWEKKTNRPPRRGDNRSACVRRRHNSGAGGSRYTHSRPLQTDGRAAALQGRSHKPTYTAILPQTLIQKTALEKHTTRLSAQVPFLFFFLFSLARVWQLSRENRVGCHCSEAALANSSFVFLENERSRSRNSIRISLIFLLRSRGHRFHYRGSVYETSFSPKK